MSLSLGLSFVFNSQQEWESIQTKPMIHPRPPSAHKKPRLTPKTLLFEDIVTKANVVLEMIPGMQAYIKDNHPQHLETLESWRYTCEYAKQVGAIWKETAIIMLDKRLPNDSKCTFHHSS